MNSELQLLLCCAIYPLHPEDVDRLHLSCQNHLDWALLRRLAVRHNLTPLLYTNLKQHASYETPPGVLAVLKQDAERNRRHVLKLLVELKQITALLAPAGISICPLKGPLLAQRLYGDVGLRMTQDLDLLVTEAQFPAASACLQAAGYRRTIMPMKLSFWPRGLPRYLLHHIAYESPGQRIPIELHWALTTTDLLPAQTTAQFLARAKPLANPAMLALSDEDLLCYLIVHGARHTWWQLKWLADIATFLRQNPGPDWQVVYKQMAALDLLRPLGQALWLAHHLFGVPVPRQLEALLDDAVVQRLAKQALQVMIAPRDYHGLAGFVQRLHSRYYRIQLKTSWRYKLGLLRLGRERDEMA